MVGSTFCGSVVASTNTTCPGDVVLTPDFGEPLRSETAVERLVRLVGHGGSTLRADGAAAVGGFGSRAPHPGRVAARRSVRRPGGLRHTAFPLRAAAFRP